MQQIVDRLQVNTTLRPSTVSLLRQSPLAAMSDFKGVMKNGWHPKGREGGKESWRGDFKGINQVVSLQMFYPAGQIQLLT